VTCDRDHVNIKVRGAEREKKPMTPRTATGHVHLAATFLPKAGESERVEQALSEAIRDVVKEDGCVRYELAETGPERLVLVEEWGSQESLEGHNAGRPLKRLNAELQGLLVKPVELAFC
jgi:quinol monooxygenase YgiN